MLSRVPLIIYAVARWGIYGSDLTGQEVWTDAAVPRSEGGVYCTSSAYLILLWISQHNSFYPFAPYIIAPKGFQQDSIVKTHLKYIW